MLLRFKGIILLLTILLVRILTLLLSSLPTIRWILRLAMCLMLISHSNSLCSYSSVLMDVLVLLPLLIRQVDLFCWIRVLLLRELCILSRYSMANVLGIFIIIMVRLLSRQTVMDAPIRVLLVRCLKDFIRLLLCILVSLCVNWPLARGKRCITLGVKATRIWHGCLWLILISVQHVI